MQGLPHYRSSRLIGQLDIARLAADLQVSDKAIYKWLSDGAVPGRRVHQLLALEGASLSATTLLQFVTR
ncbi:hypothetical protein J1C47_10385 [Jiella sp. MQZ13P-4]|uniref:Helix-turn-helix domain-containing protein n=2 Tax=Jiella sonneratiae TaxID=2816856 RepID=A0ABS3J300_9HYPH|nr:hypothetical protein [Jiella sonneratiae]